MLYKHWLGDSLASIMPDVGDFEDGSEVHCLPIHWVPYGYPAVYGVLVEPTHKIKGEYRRIGRFAVAPFNMEAHSVDNFLALRQFQLPAAEWEECLGQDSEDKAYQYRFPRLVARYRMSRNGHESYMVRVVLVCLSYILA